MTSLSNSEFSGATSAEVKTDDTHDMVLGPRPVGRFERGRKALSLMLQLQRFAIFVVLILAWNWAIKTKLLNPIYAATPRQTFGELISLLGEGLFWKDLLITLREALIGWVVGSSLGLAAGLVLGRFRYAQRLFGPYLTFTNAVPKIALAPIFILWFGVGQNSKIVTAILSVFFIVQIPTTAAVALINPDYDTVARTMGATERQRFVHVYFPGVLPAVFGALRLGAVISLLTVVFTEFLASAGGLGQRLLESTNNFDMKTAFALMIVLSLLALTLNGVIGLIERRVLRWSDSSRQLAVSL